MQARTIVPAAVFLVMAHAAACSIVAASAHRTGMHAIFFLQPLAIEPPHYARDVRPMRRTDSRNELHTPGPAVFGSLGGRQTVDISMQDDAFEISSSEYGREDDVQETSTVHCTGGVSGAWIADGPVSADRAALRAHRRVAIVIPELIAYYAAKGLQYGPAYRRLTRGWATGNGAGTATGAGTGAVAALAQLKQRFPRVGIRAHPADVDSALQLSAVVSSVGDRYAQQTRLPFAMDAAWLRSAIGDLSVVRGVCSSSHAPQPAH